MRVFRSNTKTPEEQTMFTKEKKEHPEFSDEQIWQIVKDHLSKKNAQDWPSKYRCNFLEQGLVSYADVGAGVALLKKETIDKVLNSIIGKPVLIDHQDVTKENFKQSAVGYVTDASFNPETGWYDCEFLLTDDEAKRLCSKGYSVSCAFDVRGTMAGGEWHAMKYDEELSDLEFTHLALVSNPRYEDCRIMVNSKQAVIKENKDGAYVVVVRDGSRFVVKEYEPSQQWLVEISSHSNLKDAVMAAKAHAAREGIKFRSDLGESNSKKNSEDCEQCHGTGKIKGQDCEECSGTGVIPVQNEKKNSDSNLEWILKNIQDMLTKIAGNMGFNSKENVKCKGCEKEAAAGEEYCSEACKVKHTGQDSKQQSKENKNMFKWLKSKGKSNAQESVDKEDPTKKKFNEPADIDTTKAFVNVDGEKIPVSELLKYKKADEKEEGQELLLNDEIEHEGGRHRISDMVEGYTKAKTARLANDAKKDEEKKEDDKKEEEGKETIEKRNDDNEEDKEKEKKSSDKKEDDKKEDDKKEDDEKEEKETIKKEGDDKLHEADKKKNEKSDSPNLKWFKALNSAKENALEEDAVLHQTLNQKTSRGAERYGSKKEEKK